MTESKKILGIGCIEEVYECDICHAQILIGIINRTDGTGEYTPVSTDEEIEQFIIEHDQCSNFSSDEDHQDEEADDSDWPRKRSVRWES